MEETRRTVAELVTRYELEPSLREVYVEGSFDASFLSWFLHLGNATDVTVYAIGTVEIPPAILEKYGFTSGEKQRVIALAKEIIAALGNIKQATFVVDSDLDIFFNVVIAETIVLVTDYPSLEVYLFQRELLQQWLTVTARLSSGTASQIIDSLSPPLTELFLARCAGSSLGWQMTWISLDAGVIKLKRGYQFDIAQFIDRLLQANGRMRQRTRFLAEIEALRTRLRSDPRHAMYGRDLIELLTIALRRTSAQRWIHNDGAALGSLAGAVRRESIEGETLFKAVLARVTAH
jgi:hypothetical protein